jgi:hypothetical protein
MITDRIADKFPQGMEAELEHNFGAMTLDRPGANRQLSAGLLVASARCEKGDNLSFAGRQRGKAQFILDRVGRREVSM